MKIEKNGNSHFKPFWDLKDPYLLFSPKQSVRHIPELVATYLWGFLLD